MASKKVVKNPARASRATNAIVITVVALAVLVLVGITVASLIKVDPIQSVESPEFYYLYDAGSLNTKPASDSSSQSKIRTALGDMKFTVMSAILQGNWDYSLKFERDDDNEKSEKSSSEIKDLAAGDGEYMVEYVFERIPVVNGALDYSKAHKLEVDGETVYFDRIKMIIGDTENKVGIISFYPYIAARLDNQSDDPELASDVYKVTGINVRANTTSAYTTLKELAESL